MWLRTTRLGAWLAALSIGSACAPMVEIPVGSETYRGRYPVYDWCIEMKFAENQVQQLAFYECWSGNLVNTWLPNLATGDAITFGTMRFENLRTNYNGGIRTDVIFGQHRWEQFLGRKRTFTGSVPDGTYIGEWNDGCGELTFAGGQPASYWYGPCGDPDHRHDVFGDGKHVRIQAMMLENVHMVEGHVVGIWAKGQRRYKKIFFRRN